MIYISLLYGCRQNCSLFFFFLHLPCRSSISSLTSPDHGRILNVFFVSNSNGSLCISVDFLVWIRFFYYLLSNSVGCIVGWQNAKTLRLWGAAVHQARYISLWSGAKLLSFTLSSSNVDVMAESVTLVTRRKTVELYCPLNLVFPLQSHRWTETGYWFSITGKSLPLIWFGLQHK